MKRLLSSLLFWLVVSSGVAYLWPSDAVGFDPFVGEAWLLWSLIVITMFSLGTLVRADELLPLRQRPWWVILGVAVQVTVMPAAAWLVTRLIPMDPHLAAGVILVGCVPGAMASNVLTSTARGSVAYSVSLTAVATLVSPLTVPAVLWVVSGMQAEHSLTKAAVRLALLVVLPTIVGYGAAQRWKSMGRFAERFASKVAAIALLWIIATVVAGNREKLAGVGALLLVALLWINLVGYAAGLGVGRLARLPDKYCRALTLEVGMQNAGLGTALAVSLYGKETIATIPTAAYTFGCMLTGTMLAVWWQRFSCRPPVLGDEDMDESRSV
ncbi:MAG: bile acid:sodium symporter family protein [Rubripirellula sp.]